MIFISETYEYPEEGTDDDLFEVIQMSECHNQNEENITEMMDEVDMDDLSQVEIDDADEDAEYYPTSYDALIYMEDYWGHNLQEKVSERDTVEVSTIYRQFLELVSMISNNLLTK
jgi:hypothetical protein